MLGFGLVRGRLDSLGADLRQGIPLYAWAGSASGDQTQPDLFVILLDGYPRAYVLDYAFGIDNTPFLDELAIAGSGRRARATRTICGPT